LSCDFVVHPIRWDRYPLVAADPHARSWLTLQSHRGLALNTLDAYSRGLERYVRFIEQHHLSCSSVTSAEVGLYLSGLQSNGRGLSNATMQQLLTVVRLFHAYLMEEGVRANNPTNAGTDGAGTILSVYAAKVKPPCWASCARFAGRPALRGRSVRNVDCSKSATNVSDPSGLPV
jgi:integrase/recombinase XerD